MAFFFNLLGISAMNVIVIWIKLQTYLQRKKCVRRALLIASAKSLARITVNYSLIVQRPVSFHSCLVSEDTNKRRSVTCALQKRTRNLRYPATTVNRVFVVNTASNFVFSARN